MRRTPEVALASCFFRIPTLVVGACAAVLISASAAIAHQYVRLDYNLTLDNRSRHTVFLEVFDDRPLTQTNFMQYVNAGKYDNSLMHRLSRGFVLQGGGFLFDVVAEPAMLDVSFNPDAEVDLDGNPATNNPTVMNEFSNTPNRSNIKGTLAMAKVAGDPNSATSQWFVNLNNNSGLDTNNGGFTVFAQVLGDGMTYYDAINAGASIGNYNPDIDDDGVRDGGPFFNYGAPLNGGLPTDGVPYVDGGTFKTALILDKARRIDYYGGTGASTTLNVPANDYTISTRDVFIDAGASVTGSGKLIVGTGRELAIREGITLGRPVRNGGTLSLGIDNGVVTLPSFEQTGQGKLDIDIRGTTIDTHYDRLIVSGVAMLAGELEVERLNKFHPVPVTGSGASATPTSFTILTASSISGDFTTLDLPPLTRFLWQYEKTATQVKLNVIAGDYNDDGRIDSSDYTYWRNLFSTTNPVTYATAFAGADGNGDRIVNEADYWVWRRNYGKVDASTVGPGGGGGQLASLVPEPSCGLLLLIGGMLFSAMRRRTRRG